MSKSIAAGLMCLGIVTIGFALTRGQEPGNISKPRSDALAQQAGVEPERAAMTFAEQNVEIQQLQNLCDVGAAETRLELARLDLVKYANGELPYKKNMLQAEIQLSVEEFTRARDKFAAAQKSANEEAGKHDDVEVARLAVEKAKIQHALAEENLSLLVDFVSRRRIAERQAHEKQCERELKLVKLKAAAALAHVKAELDAAKRNLDIASEAASPSVEKPR